MKKNKHHRIKITKIQNVSKMVNLSRSLVGVLFSTIGIAHGNIENILESQLPLVRGPGVSQIQLEAIAAAQGLSTLAEYLDSNRTNETLEKTLHKLMEDGQKAWLSGEKPAAALKFQEITHLALNGDWRPAQRESIHYAFIRLAQNSSQEQERRSWIERAIVAFPDLQIDDELFPVDLITEFRNSRLRLFANGITFFPFEHFPNFQILLVNGKRYFITPDLKIRLPDGRFRITAFSDELAPFTQVISSVQLQQLKEKSIQSKSILDNPKQILDGNCSKPIANISLKQAPQFTAVYSSECLRVHNQNGWQKAAIKQNNAGQLSFDDGSTKIETNNNLNTFTTLDSSPAFLNTSKEDLEKKSEPFNSQGFEPNVTGKSISRSKSPWFWVGLTALSMVALSGIHRELARESGPTRIEPVHRSGF